MKLNAKLICALAAVVLILGTASPAFTEFSKTERAELVRPIVALTPVLNKNADGLKLTEAQKEFFAD